MDSKILFVDDDVALCELVRLSLKKEPYIIELAHDGISALQKTYKWKPDLVLLDVMMPQMNGWEACRRIREMSEVPIIMLTSLGMQENIIKGLNLGADDYLTKPLSPEALLARIQAVLRRVSRSKTVSASNRLPRLQTDNIIIDLHRHEVTIDGRRVDLSPTEFRLLSVLAKNKGRVLPHQYLLKEVWGRECIDELDYLRMYISYLRRKLEKDPTHPELIQTEWSVGYRFG